MTGQQPTLEELREELEYAQSKVQEAEMNSETRRRRMLDAWEPRVRALKAQIKQMETGL